MKARQKNKQAWKFSLKYQNQLNDCKPDYSYVIQQWKSIMENNFKACGSYFIDEVSEFGPKQIEALSKINKKWQEDQE